MNKIMFDVKKFWNDRPCNIKHSFKEIGSKEYFDEVEHRRYFVEKHILDFAEFEKWKGKNVLEIGCGIGTDAIMFAKNGANVVVIDISDKSIEIAKKRFEVYGLKCSFYIGNIEELSKIIPIKKFDLIYSFGVIHHTENPNNVFEEIEKFMDENSEMRIMLYNKYSYKAFFFFIRYGYKFLFNFNKILRYFSEAQLNCPIVHLYTKKRIKKELHKFNINVNKDYIFIYNIKEYIKHIYKKNIIFHIMPDNIFRFMRKNFGWHFLIKGKLKNIFEEKK